MGSTLYIGRSDLQSDTGTSIISVSFLVTNFLRLYTYIPVSKLNMFDHFAQGGSKNGQLSRRRRLNATIGPPATTGEILSYLNGDVAEMVQSYQPGPQRMGSMSPMGTRLPAR